MTDELGFVDRPRDGGGTEDEEEEEKEEEEERGNLGRVARLIALVESKRPRAPNTMYFPRE